jgi:hypothetical protein
MSRLRRLGQRWGMALSRLGRHRAGPSTQTVGAPERRISRGWATGKRPRVGSLRSRGLTAGGIGGLSFDRGFTMST